jgi:hypothetical protein
VKAGTGSRSYNPRNVVRILVISIVDEACITRLAYYESIRARACQDLHAHLNKISAASNSNVNSNRFVGIILLRSARQASRRNWRLGICPFVKHHSLAS